MHARDFYRKTERLHPSNNSFNSSFVSSHSLYYIVDIPPLEDMSEYLQRAKELQLKNHGTARNDPEPQAPQHYPVTKQTEVTLSEHDLDVNGVRRKKEATFGGLKKGFLFASADKRGNKKPAVKTEREKQATKMARQSGAASSHASTKDSSSSEDIPFIKPQVQGTAKGLEFPEVQEAMKEAYPLLRSQGE